MNTRTLIITFVWMIMSNIGICAQEHWDAQERIELNKGVFPKNFSKAIDAIQYDLLGIERGKSHVKVIDNNTLYINLSFSLKNSVQQGDWRIAVKPDFLPSFHWAPHLTPTDRNVIDQHVFRSPALIVADDHQTLILIPDLDIMQKGTPVRWYMDMDASSNTLILGMCNNHVSEHVLFERDQETTYPKGDIEIGFYLMYSDSKEVLRNPFKKPLEFMWSRWGHTAYVKGNPVKESLEKYVQHTYNWAFNSWSEMNGKENYIAELKVARAFYYYLLLEAFGNVPIIDRFDVPDGYLPATEPRSKVFEFVESELKNNINNLSEDVLNTYGRFNKWNAKMLLARLYLNAEAWIGTPMYNECENLCNEIIATNKYRLDGDYSLPFSTNNELSNETMFVIPFDETKSGGQIYMWARKTLHYSQMQTFNLQATWLDGGCVGVPTFFDNYIEGDKRLEKTWRMGQQYALDGTPLWTNGWCGDPQMLLSYTKDVTNISGDATMYQGYRFGKYEIKIGATGTPDNDYVIMRYAEVLMMKAECILRTGGSSQEAAELVNEVRRRNFDTTNELTGSELEATTIYNGVPVKYGRFLQELGVEFALEGLRRSQLIRFDNNFTKGTWWEHQPTNDTKRNLMLIPFDQLQRNSNLVQNPK